MLESIKLFNNLKFNSNKNFKDHMFNINQNHTYFILSDYLKDICKNDINIKDFLGLITIYYYNNEFNLEENDKIYINNYISKFIYINKTENLDINNYYENNIKEYNNKALDILKNIVNKTSKKAREHYIKMYFLYDSFLKEFKDINNKIIIYERDKNLKLLKELDNNININNCIEEEKEKLNLVKEYENFRKDIFFDMLEKDLNKDIINYDGILYLIDIIKIKLLYICPINKKYNYIKEQINNIIDIKYIKQLIDNKVFEYNDLINIFNFIMEIIEKFQSEENDKKLEEIKNILKNEINSNTNNINSFLCNLLKNIIYIIEKLENEVYYYRTKIIYNNSS